MKQRKGWRMSCDVGKPFRHFTYVTNHSPTLSSLYLCHSSFSIPSVVSSISQLILQPFFLFSYVSGFSLTSPGEPLTVQVLKRKWGAESIGKLPHRFISGKTTALFMSLRGRPAFGRTTVLVPVLAVEDLPLGRTLWWWWWWWWYLPLLTLKVLTPSECEFTTFEMTLFYRKAIKHNAY